MNIKSLYTKLLLSFLAVLFITEILIFGLFIATAGRSFRGRVDRQYITKLMLFKILVQEKINASSDTSFIQNSEIIKLLYSLSKLFDIDIWVTLDKKRIFKTFSTPIDIAALKLEKPDVIKDGIKLYHLSRRELSYYAQILITVDKKQHLLHIHFQKEHEWEGEKGLKAFFLFGLIGIGIIIAVLIIPLTKLITRRIKELNHCALEFANGNLELRADIKGRDEIAELGLSFNFMADKLERMIQGNKQLTANISHELRSPLARIRLSEELIKDKLDPTVVQNIKRYLKSIDQDIEILDNLIDKILKLSKIDLHESSISMEQIDFIKLLTNLKEKFGPSLQQKKLTLNINTDKPPLILTCDNEILLSILSNLFDNAIKFTIEKDVINITAFRTKNDIFTFTITNSYRKLNPKELKQIFKPFYRIKNSKDSGSGLGLTIVKKQVKLCSASITAQNSESGLMFEIQFSNP